MWTVLGESEESPHNEWWGHSMLAIGQHLYDLYIWVFSYSIQHCLDAFYISESKWLFSHPFSTAFYLQVIEFLSLRYSFLTKHVIIFMTTYSIGSGSWKLKVWRWYYLNKSLGSTSNFRVVKTSIDLFLQWITLFIFLKMVVYLSSAFLC